MKRRGVKIILIITACVVFFYGYRYIKIPVETKTAHMIQLEDTISTDVYIARDEVVYQTENTGTMYSYITEGARVAKNMRIATVYRGDVENDLIRELNNIDKKVQELLGEKQKHEIFTIGSNSKESTMENIKNDVISAAINNDLSKISSYKRTINSLYNKDSDKTEDIINQLNARKREIEAQLGNDKSDIYSTISGVYSRNVDNFEEVLTLDNVVNYTVDDFNNLKNIQMDNNLSDTVSSGESVCKVVDNHVWYAVTTMPKQKAELIKDKNNLLIRFDSLPGVEVSAHVIYISQEEENVVVVLKSERYLEGVYGIRNGKMDIVVNRYTGFEVPVYAIRISDGKKGVLIANGLSEIFCECDVIYSDEEKETAIIYPSENAKRELSAGDKIVLGEKTQ